MNNGGLARLRAFYTMLAVREAEAEVSAAYVACDGGWAHDAAEDEREAMDVRSSGSDAEKSQVSHSARAQSLLPQRH